MARRNKSECFTPTAFRQACIPVLRAPPERVSREISDKRAEAHCQAAYTVSNFPLTRCDVAWRVLHWRSAALDY